MSSVEREQFEMAAKAAGIKCRPADFELAGGLVLASHPSGFPTVWNPLIDDGDALRLAVALDLTTRHYSGSTVAQSGIPGTPCAYEEVTNHSDPCAAARRAIVLAAAAIGRAMP